MGEEISNTPLEFVEEESDDSFDEMYVQEIRSSRRANEAERGSETRLSKESVIELNEPEPQKEEEEMETKKEEMEKKEIETEKKEMETEKKEEKKKTGFWCRRRYIV